MNKLCYCYALLVQKGTNLLETLAYPLIHKKKGGLTVEKTRYGGGKRLVSEYYYPSAAGKKPVLIYIHGGGWVSGTLRMRKPYCLAFANEGYFVMNTGYDYAPQKRFPVPLIQIFQAIEALLDDAEKYNLDTERIAIGGESAGAYYAAFVAAITKNPSLYDELGIGFKYRDSFGIKSCVLLNGAFDHISLSMTRFLNMNTFLTSFYGMTKKQLLAAKGDDSTRLFSPMDFITADFPPSVVGEGAHDGLRRESENIKRLFSRLGIPHTSFMAKGIVGIHGFCLAVDTKEGRRCFNITLDYVNRALNG